MALCEGAAESLAATPENIAAAKSFVFGKWRERAKELGRDDPLDLSDACKFTSLFAALVFGGTLHGNFFHQWIALPDGRTLDLNDEAADVITMLRGEMPDDAKPYADEMRKKLPPSLYAPDDRHMRSRGNRQSMASVRPRVQRWADEFLRGRMLGEVAAEVIAAKAMVAAFYAKFDNSKLKGRVSVSLEVTGDTDIELEYVGTDWQYRQKGLASKAMRVITRLADQYRVTLTLYVDPDAGADENSPDAEQLAEWYAGFGFEEQDYWTHLVRKPFGR